MRLSDLGRSRLGGGGRRGQVVSIGVVYRPEAGHFSKQVTLPVPISTGEEIYRAALELLAAREPRREVGTLGVGLAGLTDADSGQMGLFTGEGRPRNERLETAIEE